MSAPRSSAARVRSALDGLGMRDRVRDVAQSTRTAAQAAEALGCEVSQIVKSLVFRARDSDRPVLVVASGANRVDESKVARLLGEPVGKADAAFVRTHTGYAIGGVAPLGHPAPIDTFIDRDLMSQERVWAAAGSPYALFELTPQELERVSGGRVADVKA